MVGLTKKYFNEFFKPNYYALRNVLTFLLPARRSQYDFNTERIKALNKKLLISNSKRKNAIAIELSSHHIERIFLAFLLSEEMGTYFDAMTRFADGDILGSVLSKKSFGSSWKSVGNFCIFNWFFQHFLWLNFYKP